MHEYTPKDNPAYLPKVRGDKRSKKKKHPVPDEYRHKTEGRRPSPPVPSTDTLDYVDDDGS